MAVWFSARETRGLDPELVRMLDQARGLSGVPFHISSGYRKGDPLSHGEVPGKGVDIKCATSRRRQLIYDALRAVGFTRIGVYDRHLHGDIAKGRKYPQNVTWVGKSK